MTQRPLHSPPGATTSRRLLVSAGQAAPWPIDRPGRWPRRRLGGPLPVAGIVWVLSACASKDKKPDTTAPDPVVTSVVVSPPSQTLTGIGSAGQLTASVTNTNGAVTSPSVSWSSDAPSVVSVSGSGASASVTAVSAGTATITATSEGVSGTASVTVVPGSQTLAVTIEGGGGVSSTPSGLTCQGTACTGDFPFGAQVMLAATPDVGNRPGEWGGACTGTAPCSLVMDQMRNVTVRFDPKVESNGLSPEINDLIADTLITTLTSLGFPLYTGATPPSLEGIYQVSPVVLVASNVPGDPSNLQFVDYFMRLYDQDDANLTMSLDYVNGTSMGTGLSTYIVGTDSTFSIVTELVSTIGADTSYNLQMVSGKRRPGGIGDLYIAFFMLDNRGKSPPWIPNGTGRVARDGDGFSGEVASLPQIAGFSWRMSGWGGSGYAMLGAVHPQ